MKRLVTFALLLSAVCFGAPVDLNMGGVRARFEGNVLVRLETPRRKVLFESKETPEAAGAHMLSGKCAAADWTAVDPERSDAVRQSATLSGAAEGRLEQAWHPAGAARGITFSQRATLQAPGLWGVEWAAGYIPLDYNIIVPGRSGLRLDSRLPGRTHTFDYPMSWEAQLVIVEGDGRGFLVWCEDPKGTFKRLEVRRTNAGWRLRFVAMPFAPFEARSAHAPPPWRIETYEGDWRVAARKYRDWAEAHFEPTAIGEQQPGWVKDIRCCVIMGLDHDMLETLPTRLDPAQTLLYIPAWRADGYDRDYPDYAEARAALRPFMARAHALGFRVMLHVNYFGCDPLNPVWKCFEAHQMRAPFGSHEKLWWLWEPAEPDIKFGYINPALKAWRALFIERMEALCAEYAVDALHLDQTLAIYNDHNGLLEGMSCIQGNIALHRELRAALPEVALSGEGLNEITYRHEAFAQRHAWGLSHHKGTYDATRLRRAHPVSSYLFRGHTILYGYLGCSPPDDGQLYAAWNEAYEHWGVIPTLKPRAQALAQPRAFARQFFDEAGFWQEARLEIAMEEAWPDTVAFPFRTAGARRVVRTTDHRLLAGAREISRTVYGVDRAMLPGAIDGWRAYNKEALIGLDPRHWYAYFDRPRPYDVLHVNRLPDGLTVAGAAGRDALAFVGVKPAENWDIRLAARLDAMTGGARLADGTVRTAHGPYEDEYGAQFVPNGDGFHAHPPWRGTVGEVFAEFELSLPKNVQAFQTEVAMDFGGLEPKTDGVTYRVRACHGGQRAEAEVHHAAEEPATLSLDLRPFAGGPVRLRLSAGPGPHNEVGYDWARWRSPRITRAVPEQVRIRVGGVRAGNWALAGRKTRRVSADTPDFEAEVSVPGRLYVVETLPEPHTLPIDLANTPFTAPFLQGGTVARNPGVACATTAEMRCGGVPRRGIFAHPPEKGRTQIDFLVHLPERGARFEGWAGLRDRADSGGVAFRVEMNGFPVAEYQTDATKWHRLSADLSPWAGRAAVLSLVTDALGDDRCDWACWGEPMLR